MALLVPAFAQVHLRLLVAARSVVQARRHAYTVSDVLSASAWAREQPCLWCPSRLRLRSARRAELSRRKPFGFVHLTTFRRLPQFQRHLEEHVGNFSLRLPFTVNSIPALSPHTARKEPFPTFSSEPLFLLLENLHHPQVFPVLHYTAPTPHLLKLCAYLTAFPFVNFTESVETQNL